MNILITGAGQDSSYLAEFLLSQNHNVFVMTRRSCTSDHWRFAKAKDNPNFQFIDGDITDPHVLISFLRAVRTDELYNLAAQSHVGTSFTNPTSTWMSVAQGAFNVFEAVKLISPDTCVYQASSSEMFGDMVSYIGNFDQFDQIVHQRYTKGLNRWCKENLDRSDGVFQSIETPFNPQSPYGVAKLAAHNMARIYREAYGLKIVSGILFNHESPRRGLKFVTRKITNYFWKIGLLWKTGCPFAGPKLKLGNLDICRDWGYAPEYVEYMVEMVRDDKFEDRVLATGKTISIREFAQRAMEITFRGKETDLSKFIEIDDSLKRPSEVPYLKGVSDWKPKVDVYQVIENMLEGENGKV